MQDDLDTTLKRLLGPGRPEVTCEHCFDRLDHYVEAELEGKDPEAAVPGLGPHLQGCPACAEDHASLLALLRADREALESDGGRDLLST